MAYEELAPGIVKERDNAPQGYELLRGLHPRDNAPQWYELLRGIHHKRDNAPQAYELLRDLRDHHKRGEAAADDDELCCDCRLFRTESSPRTDIR